MAYSDELKRCVVLFASAAENQGMTQQQIAEVFHMSQATVSNILRKFRKP